MIPSKKFQPERTNMPKTRTVIVKVSYTVDEYYRVKADAGASDPTICSVFRTCGALTGRHDPLTIISDREWDAELSIVNPKRAPKLPRGGTIDLVADTYEI
jgi:hypothetical protein